MCLAKITHDAFDSSDETVRIGYKWVDKSVSGGYRSPCQFKPYAEGWGEAENYGLSTIWNQDEGFGYQRGFHIFTDLAVANQHWLARAKWGCVLVEVEYKGVIVAGLERQDSETKFDPTKPMVEVVVAKHMRIVKELQDAMSC